jgi:hypothetical protein
MSGEPNNTNPNARRMNEVFDFESRPGIAVVRPEIAKQLSEGLKKQRAEQLADEAKIQRGLPLLPYHPDDEEEDGWTEPTWFLEWPMWQFLLLSVLCLAGVWQLGEWACDLWQWARMELVKGGLL